MTEPLWWALAAGGSAALAIWGHPPGRRVLHYVFKPLTMVLIIGLLWRQTPAGAPLLPWLTAALGLSLVGDVLLMLPARAFLGGLLAFLGALGLYAIAFARELAWTPRMWLAPLPAIVLAQWVLRALWPHLRRLRVPVVIYVTAMVVMSTCALARLAVPSLPLASAAWGAAGALLFMLGDTLLALRRFAHRRVPYALELGAYFAAQWALAATAWA
ncbi:MAG: lysoplasmalogenase [Deltaproteobacteria bacterium]|nr:lysoplasmalogenase [Deltaproteobacteria bacterium]